MNFREIWGEITDFCSENYIWVILMAVILAGVFFAAVWNRRKKNTDTTMGNSGSGQKKDDWMEDFEQRMAAFERREGCAWEKAMQLDASDEKEPSRDQTANPDISTQQWEPKGKENSDSQTCINEAAEWDKMPAASASAGCVRVSENGGMDVKVKVKVTGIRVVYDPEKMQATEAAEGFGPEEKTANNVVENRLPDPAAAYNETGMTQGKWENETPDPEVVIHKINIVKKEAIDENVSVSRSGRMYSEEQLRQQIRK